MLQVILVVAGAVAALLGFAATKPDSFRVQRSARMKAPPEEIFALIDDFRNWVKWSPWEKLDPAMKRSYSGAASGPGAAYAWEGNGKAGAGRMVISETSPPSHLKVNLAFTKPFKANNTAEFVLEPDGDSTEVTWTVHGPQLFMGKVMGVFVSMDKLMGNDFATGLANLKSVVEQS